jgi:hypothetical protein
MPTYIDEFGLGIACKSGLITHDQGSGCLVLITWFLTTFPSAMWNPLYLATNELLTDMRIPFCRVAIFSGRGLKCGHKGQHNLGRASREA